MPDRNDLVDVASVAACFNILSDIQRSLETADNYYDFLTEINACTSLQYILSMRDVRTRIPIDIDALRDSAALVNRVISDKLAPKEIVDSFKLIQPILYRCCGYSKVKFNGRTTDS